MTLTQGQTGREKVGRGGKGRERLGPAFLYLIPRSHGHMDEEGEEHGQGCVYPGKLCFTCLLKFIMADNLARNPCTSPNTHLALLHSYIQSDQPNAEPSHP